VVILEGGIQTLPEAQRLATLCRGGRIGVRRIGAARLRRQHCGKTRENHEYEEKLCGALDPRIGKSHQT
jgi:hypothetical protein